MPTKQDILATYFGLHHSEALLIEDSATYLQMAKSSHVHTLGISHALNQNIFLPSDIILHH